MDLSSAIYRLEGARADYDPLLDLIGDSRFVLLGEAESRDNSTRSSILMPSRAVEPLDRNAGGEQAELPEIFPSGF